VAHEFLGEESVYDDDESWSFDKIDNSLVEWSFQGALNGRLLIIFNGAIQSLLKVGKCLFFFALFDIKVKDQQVVLPNRFLQLRLIK
jgi:hypothetical protein